METDAQMKIVLRKEDERNVHSQCGEDGVIETLFATLGIREGTAVEFGAWDGVYLCNTANLRMKGWKTILIEADEHKADALRMLENDKTSIFIEQVEESGQHSLDAILDRANIVDVDFLSIDIDGDDIHILSSLKRIPKVICVEFNPAIPPPHAVTNPRGQHKGSSLAAIQAIANAKQYELVYATYCNAFYVWRPMASPFQIMDMWQAFHLSPRPTLAAFYDGEFRILGADGANAYRHAWSTVPIFVPRVPRTLLGWPPAIWKVALTYIYCSIASPIFYARALLIEAFSQLRRRL